LLIFLFKDLLICFIVANAVLFDKIFVLNPLKVFAYIEQQANVLFFNLTNFVYL